MPSQTLLISRYFVKSGQADALATKLGDNELTALTATTMSIAQKFSEYLVGDVRRELLDFIEAPKDIATLLPTTPYIQLRHVEVKPEAMDEYRQWREETIFDVVRNADDVQPS